MENRRDMWELLRSLCGAWSGPWMMIGDFNEAMCQYEHFSETPRPERQMMDFREILSHCDLHDLGFKVGEGMSVFASIVGSQTQIGLCSSQRQISSISPPPALTTRRSCSLFNRIHKLKEGTVSGMKLCGRGRRN